MSKMWDRHILHFRVPQSKANKVLNLVNIMVSDMKKTAPVDTGRLRDTMFAVTRVEKG